jgi:hypothetical protein
VDPKADPIRREVKHLYSKDEKLGIGFEATFKDYPKYKYSKVI